jgi:3-oxoacyl-[acyl-carrier protein] reductase
MKQVYSDLSGMVVVVTGGSRGIGAATCREFAANGARVAVVGRDQAAIDSVVERIHADGGHAVGATADCTDLASVERMRLRVEHEFGPVEVLAAFAGGGIIRPGPFEEVTEEQWRAVIDGNLTATFLTVKSFLPGMAERGRGSIITMASTAGRIPSPAPAPYAASKAAVLMLTRNLAVEFGKRGVRINCIAPSTIMTERTKAHIPEAVQREIIAALPLGRLGTPEDVARAALFLASEAASWMTGVTLDVAGGKVMT